MGVLAFRWPAFRVHDATVLAGFISLQSSGIVERPASWVVHASTPVTYALLGAVFVAVAALRRRRALALGVPVAMAAASLTTEALKHAGTLRYSPVLPFYDQIPTPSWPSGHATAVMMVALCAVIVSPPRLRPAIAALGGALVLTVSCALLILGEHYPSDLLGGYLVAATWTSLLLAATWSRLPVESRTPAARAQTRVRAALGAGAAAAVIAVAAEAIFAATRLRTAVDTTVAGAAVLAAVAGGAVTLAAVALRPPRGAGRERDAAAKLTSARA